MRKFKMTPKRWMILFVILGLALLIFVVLIGVNYEANLLLVATGFVSFFVAGIFHNIRKWEKEKSNSKVRSKKIITKSKFYHRL